MIYFKWFLVLLCYSVIIFFSAESFPVSFQFSYYDKIEHFSAYALLGFLIGWALGKTRFRRFILWGLLVLAIAGFANEIFQLYVPGRQADVWDWVADMLGGTMGVMLERYLSSLFLRRPMIESEQ